MKRLLFVALLVGFGCEDKEKDCAGVEGGNNICGCTDSTATNYDSTATFDDGSCEYDTTPPTVTITFSTQGSVSEVVSITCISTDNEGVEKVELWVNGVSIGVTDNTEPYSLDWNTTTHDDGSYVITVRSYDTSGNTTDSDPITLVVDNIDDVPPTVSITSPVSGQTVSEIVTITVTTQDNEGISRVEFFIDDSLVLSDTESPYQYDWNTATYDDTSYTVKVISYDISGNSTPSQPIMLIVDNIVDEDPEPKDCAGVEGGNNICGCTDSTATNYDSTATYNDESCEYDTTPPSATILSPASGATVSEITTIEVYATDDSGIENLSSLLMIHYILQTQNHHISMIGIHQVIVIALIIL